MKLRKIISKNSYSFSNPKFLYWTKCVLVAIIVIALFGIVIGNWIKTDNLIAELENTTPAPRNTEIEDALKKMANNSEKLAHNSEKLASNSDKMIRAIDALNPRKLLLEVLKESSEL